MFILHVDLAVNPGATEDLEAVFRNTFSTAISQQPGFQAVDLLKPSESAKDYRLTIAFANQQLQQQWVATDLHQEVWPQIESRCSRYSVSYYTGV